MDQQCVTNKLLNCFFFIIIDILKTKIASVYNCNVDQCELKKVNWMCNNASHVDSNLNAEMYLLTHFVDQSHVRYAFIEPTVCTFICKDHLIGSIIVQILNYTLVNRVNM